jgi:hypothetical protein
MYIGVCGRAAHMMCSQDRESAREHKAGCWLGYSYNHKRMGPLVQQRGGGLQSSDTRAYAAAKIYVPLPFYIYYIQAPARYMGR